MSSSGSAQQGGMVVVTQTNPSSPQSVSVGNPNPHKTSQSCLLFLGFIQIIIGLTGTGLTVFMFIKDNGASFLSFFSVGTFSYIINGFFTIGAVTSPNRRVTSVCTNMIATVAAGAGTVAYAIDATQRTPCFYPFGCQEDKHLESLMDAILGFHCLELFITVLISGFFCKLSSNSGNTQPSVYNIPGNASMAPPNYSTAVSMVQLPPQTTTVSEPADRQSSPRLSEPADRQSSPRLSDPPPYSEAIKCVEAHL